MIISVTSRACRISSYSYRRLVHMVQKLDRMLPSLNDDLKMMSILLRKDIKKYHPPQRHASFSHRKTALAYYHASILVRIANRHVCTHSEGQTIDECLDTGIKLLTRKIEKFKSLRFSSDSDYPNHESIRGGVLYGER